MTKCFVYPYYFSSSILMRSDFRNFRSWSLILNSGLVERVVTRDVLSEDFSPCLLTPMVASRTRKMSYPPSLMRETTSAICSESESDSLMASPSSFIGCFSCGSTGSPIGVCLGCKHPHRCFRCLWPLNGFDREHRLAPL